MAYPKHPNIPTKLYHLPTAYGKIASYNQLLIGNVGVAASKPVVPVVHGGGRRFAIAFVSS